MPSLNKVILIGNLCADPELKATPSGVNVTSFAIGIQRKYKEQDGSYKSDFINIVAWRQTAEFICRYFRKGDPIVICGSLQTRSWQDQQGQKRYATEVIADEAGFCAKKDAGRAPMPGDVDAPAVRAEAASAAGQAAPAPVPNFEEIKGDEDLPF